MVTCAPVPRSPYYRTPETPSGAVPDVGVSPKPLALAPQDVLPLAGEMPHAPLAAPPVPQKKRKGPHVNLTWRADFLKAYEAAGGFYAAAKTAGVNSTTAYDEMARNPAFRTQVEEAKQRYADSREANLARLADNGNVVGDIVLLKKFRPHEYIEKNLTITASFSAELGPDDGRALLQAMLGDATQSTRHALAPPPTP